MGHIRLPALPTSKKWREVVGLIGAGAAVEEIADAAADAPVTRSISVPQALWK